MNRKRRPLPVSSRCNIAQRSCKETMRRAKGPRMANSVEDRGRGARMARPDEGAYCRYVTEEQRRQLDRLGHSRALRPLNRTPGISMTLSAPHRFFATSFRDVAPGRVRERSAFPIRVRQLTSAPRNSLQRCHSCFPEVSAHGCFAHSLFPPVPCSRDRLRSLRRTTLSRTVRDRPSSPWTPVATFRKEMPARSSCRAKDWLEPASG